MARWVKSYQTKTPFSIGRTRDDSLIYFYYHQDMNYYSRSECILAVRTPCLDPQVGTWHNKFLRNSYEHDIGRAVLFDTVE